ncbi:XRE family transcriptional regulator [Ktedonosporobacter rubrisoli]|uniref:XRE family transcriptional regulator n=1 Tax=Ktedonosporobacter rubrisoli TaxID=2509675 RepID=A0A4P6JLM9_KTERU|nr:helix-turn-helix transcriptional regulator [Ktedonosporobacter rubrisoli]QBD75983.1 XRE family transcriptional regulator [Ktedonosporobacter rubrisoli]
MEDRRKHDKQRREELGNFLRTRRARLSPEQIGMPAAGRRRTPGLRREEVAVMAGVSSTWYTYLEQGRAIQVSSSVLASIASVLHLSEDEKSHLFVLARQPLPVKSEASCEIVRPAYQRVLQALETEIPAFITGRTYDVLAWNRAACAVFGDFSALLESERNLLWQLFTDSPFHRLFAESAARERYAQEVLETFRARVNQYLDEPTIADFIARLELASPEFRQKWSQHNVRQACTIWQALRHPAVGELNFEMATFQVVNHTDMRCHMHTPADEATAGKIHELLAAEQRITKAERLECIEIVKRS